MTRWMNIGPDYSYGKESWNSFIGKLKELKPEVEVVGELWPKLLEKDFTPFIQKIIAAKPDAVWASIWGNDACPYRAAAAMRLLHTIGRRIRRFRQLPCSVFLEAAVGQRGVHV